MNTSKIIVLAFGLFFTGAAFSQTAQKSKVPPPSDQASGYTYDFDKTRQLILDRISNPSQANIDAKLLVEANDFPKTNGKNLTNDFYDKLRQWMEKNPNLIINTLKHRKDIVTQY